MNLKPAIVNIKVDGALSPVMFRDGAKSPAYQYPILRIEKGQQAGREISVMAKILIGRGEECDLRLVEERISRRHATVELNGTGAMLRDLGGVNGTYVENRRVSELQLSDGDCFQIGSVRIVFLASPESGRKTRPEVQPSNIHLKKRPSKPASNSSGSVAQADIPSAELISSAYRFVRLVGNSPKFLSAVNMALKAAPYTTSILICGPTGSGKELIARLVHEQSLRSEKLFLAVNCAALPEGLQESELFGHERGAFTGASQVKHGYFKLSDGGTLFLDEVGDLSPNTQVKLLRAVESGEFFPVGGGKALKVDVRIVAATNRNLSAEVAAGRFREDLYHRLNVIRIDLPALAERPGDARLLVKHFLSRKATELKRPACSISERALIALDNYAWPGNVRELCNMIERAIVLSHGTELDLSDFPVEVAQPSVPPPGHSSQSSRSTQPISLAEAECRAISDALAATGWQKTKAAEILGISWPTLQKKIGEYGLMPPKESLDAHKNI